MRLYKISATIPSADNDSGPTQFKRWVGSQSEAASARKDALAAGATRATTDTKEIDVPTDKSGLLEFLNTSDAI